MQAINTAIEFITLPCSCGCEEFVEVDASMLDHSNDARFRREFRPVGYSGPHNGFIVSGSTGYVYASIECLNRMNE